MARSLGIDIETDDLAGVVDPFGHGVAVCAGRVERRIDAPVEQVPMPIAVPTHIGPYDLTDVVDPHGVAPQGRDAPGGSSVVKTPWLQRKPCRVLSGLR